MNKIFIIFIWNWRLLSPIINNNHLPNQSCSWFIECMYILKIRILVLLLFRYLSTKQLRICNRKLRLHIFRCCFHQIQFVQPATIDMTTNDVCSELLCFQPTQTYIHLSMVPHTFTFTSIADTHTSNLATDRSKKKITQQNIYRLFGERTTKKLP